MTDFKSLDALNQVGEFHKTFKAPIQRTPGIPDPARAKLRYDLLAEELAEFREAIETNDLVGAADALCDLQYVLAGAVLEFGLGQDFVDLFNEVHRSNMSKACQSLAEAEETVAHYYRLNGTEACIEEDNGRYLVYRKSDRKTLKSIAYSPADLATFLKKHEDSSVS
jgi:predicted HAD superfamily Cof-like phosphohydrolase